MKKLKKPLIYLLGLSFLGLSVSLFNQSNLGMGSWDALNRNFHEGLLIPYRYLTPIVALVLVGVAYLLEKKKPDIWMLFPLVLSAYIGLVIDVLILVIPLVSEMALIYNILYVAMALIFIAIGLNLIVLCNYPLPALDQFCLAISHKFNISFGKGKLLGEVIALLLTVIVGLAFSHEEFWFYLGYNTIIMILFVGALVDLFAKPIKKLLGDMNDNRDIR
ncbi:MAG: hypothetical protein RBR66_00160 [Candidatus Izemoplasmatales bacterium]|jgi:uncharacterized membrane protein YczE|nr:hypothetical protein [Candidatus Izemoplasmatales bacterium]